MLSQNGSNLRTDIGLKKKKPTKPSKAVILQSTAHGIPTYTGVG